MFASSSSGGDPEVAGPGGFGSGPLLPTTHGAGPSAAGFLFSASSSGSAPSTASYKRTAGMIVGVGLFLFMVLSEGYRYAVFALMLTGLGFTFSKYLSDWLLSKDDGTPEMREVSNPIREGANAFLQTQYGAIAKMSIAVAIGILLSYQLRPSGMAGGVNSMSSFTLGLLAALSFCVGAACSAAAGYVSMEIAARTNIRVASAARRGYMEALAICFRGGAFSAILVLALCVAGVSLLHTLMYAVFTNDWEPGSSEGITPGDIPLLCVGFGFGASFVALFMQLGGGIYTKGADVGADMVGKIEHGIPEDDPRNPAVIADLVGDMVGDCVGSSADIFESSE